MEFSTKQALITPLLSASTWLNIFIASIRQRVSPAATLWPISKNGLAPGVGARNTVPTIGERSVWPLLVIGSVGMVLASIGVVTAVGGFGIGAMGV